MKSILNPDLYHGKNKKKNFFEGWYFKVVSKDKKHCYAFIPGISLTDNALNNHSFIQILDGYKKKFKYCKYKTASFIPSNSPFKIDIEENSFSLSKLTLNINTNDFIIKGSLSFNKIIKWKDSFINPGSMGFYNYFSFMECYSQVCALDGYITGKLDINGDLIDFDGGKVYIEKNWGKSFPIEWIWIQNNTFEDNRATLTCSIGQIPFPIGDFRGFLIALTLDNQLYKFTTINRSKLDFDFINNGIEITVSNSKEQLSIKTTTYKDDFILCYGPKNGEMTPFVNETLCGKVEIKVINLKTFECIYKGEGYNTGVEYGGNYLNKKEM